MASASSDQARPMMSRSSGASTRPPTGTPIIAWSRMSPARGSWPAILTEARFKAAAVESDVIPVQVPTTSRTDEATAVSDPHWASLAETLRCRLELCDPSLMGSYAEQLVADHLGGYLDPDGWSGTDIRWTPVEPLHQISTEIEIQVKSAPPLQHVQSRTGQVGHVRHSRHAVADRPQI